MDNAKIIQSVLDNVLFQQSDGTIILSKTQELLRKMAFKLPTKGLGKAEPCRHVVAIELACRLENIHYDKSKLFSHAPLSQKDYQQALNLAKSVLQISLVKVQTLDILSIQFDTTLKSAALSILDEYNTLYVSKLDAVRRANIGDMSSPVYLAVAFYVASLRKKRKPMLDKRKIIQAAEVDSNAFKSVERSMLGVVMPSKTEMSPTLVPTVIQCDPHSKTIPSKLALQASNGTMTQSSLINNSQSVLNRTALLKKTLRRVHINLPEEKGITNTLCVSDSHDIGVGKNDMSSVIAHPLPLPLPPHTSITTSTLPRHTSTSTSTSTSTPHSSLHPHPENIRYVTAIPHGNHHEKRLQELGLVADTEALAKVDSENSQRMLTSQRNAERLQFLAIKERMLAKRRKSQAIEESGNGCAEYADEDRNIKIAKSS